MKCIYTKEVSEAMTENRRIINITESTNEALKHIMDKRKLNSCEKALKFLLEVEAVSNPVTLEVKKCNRCQKQVKDEIKENVKHCHIEDTDCQGKIKKSYRIELQSGASEALKTNSGSTVAKEDQGEQKDQQVQTEVKDQKEEERIRREYVYGKK
jgi:4-diphosphocytidyl-2C-methyl-D-erythritol kinase